MTDIPRWTAFLAALAIQMSSVAAPPADSPAERTIESIAGEMARLYVFPDVAEQSADELRKRLADGAYDGLVGAELARALTRDLVSISNDRHVRVWYRPGAFDNAATDAERETVPPAVLAAAERRNFGFREVRILDGNIGYLKLNEFSGIPQADATAHASMAFLQGVDALIYDLRDNGGGSPEMVRLLQSYLFPESPSTHLNSLYYRAEDRTETYRTLGPLPSRRHAETPVFVLTSSYTFSAAEEFAYNLHARGRALVVGETSGGGAHPGGDYPLTDGFAMFIPTGRAINPVTNSNWEGAGVPVDVECDASRALDHAHLLALDAVAESADEPLAREIAFARDARIARLDPVIPSEASRSAYAGNYGERHIELRNGTLMYRRGDAPWRTLIGVGTHSFVIEGVPGFRMRFELDADGAAVAIVGEYVQGHTDRSHRTP